MSGIILTVLPPTTYTFSSLQGASATQFLTLAEHIDVSQFESGILQVRLHAATNTQDTINVAVLPDGYTPDDPNPGSGSTMGWDAIPFAQVIAICNVAIGTSPTVPSFLTAAFTAPFPDLVRIGLLCQRGAGAASTTFVRISVDLALKTGDDAAPMLPRTPGAYIGYLPATLPGRDLRAPPRATMGRPGPKLSGPSLAPASPTGLSAPLQRPCDRCQ